MSELHYHYFPNSHWCRVVSMALAEKGLSVERHLVDITRNATFEPEYMRLNPKGVVPTLVIDGRAVCNSLNIAPALDAVGGPPLYTGREDAEAVQAWVKQLECFPLMLFSYSVWVLGRRGERSKDILADKITRARDYADRYPELEEHYGRKQVFFEEFSLALHDPRHVESEKRAWSAFLDELASTVQDQDWISGDFSFADCAATSILYRLVDLPLLAHWHPDHGGSESHPLYRYFQRLTQRPSFAAVYRDDPLIGSW